MPPRRCGTTAARKVIDLVSFLFSFPAIRHSQILVFFFGCCVCYPVVRTFRFHLDLLRAVAHGVLFRHGSYNPGSEKVSLFLLRCWCSCTVTSFPCTVCLRTCRCMVAKLSRLCFPERPEAKLHRVLLSCFHPVPAALRFFLRYGRFCLLAYLHLGVDRYTQAIYNHLDEYLSKVKSDPF